MAVSLVCEQLAGGRITAIDRSATAIQRAAERNAEHLASGTAVLLQIDLADLWNQGHHRGPTIVVLRHRETSPAELALVCRVRDPSGRHAEEIKGERAASAADQRVTRSWASVHP